jgi:hypothetical protein
MDQVVVAVLEWAREWRLPGAAITSQWEESWD